MYFVIYIPILAILNNINLTRNILLHGVSLVNKANMHKLGILTSKFCEKYYSETHYFFLKFTILQTEKSLENVAGVRSTN